VTGNVPALAFCTIADAAYFPGVVALVNSLRLQGHHEPLIVLDLGLTASQRDQLRGTCQFVTPAQPRHPWLLAPHALLAAPADVSVYLDADVLVTAPLDRVLDDARAGRLCAFSDWLADRWFAEWEEQFDLPDPPRHQPYRNAGFVALAPGAFPGLLERWAELCDRLADTRIDERAVDYTSPTGLPDQDVFNALLMTEVQPEQLSAGDPALVSQGNEQLGATRVVDPRAVVCERDGRRVLLLHSFSAPKPWEPSARGYLPDTAYLRCLRRLLVGPDLAVRASASAAWLAPGLRGALTMRVLTTRTALRPRTRWRAWRSS
jgi:hypothetical protein